MKNYSELTDEEKMALIEKVKSYPRPAKFAKSEEVVIEEAVEETTASSEEPAPVTKSKKSKKTNQ